MATHCSWLKIFKTKSDTAVDNKSQSYFQLWAPGINISASFTVSSDPSPLHHPLDFICLSCPGGVWSHQQPTDPVQALTAARKKIESESEAGLWAPWWEFVIKPPEVLWFLLDPDSLWLYEMKQVNDHLTPGDLGPQWRCLSRCLVSFLELGWIASKRVW